MGYFASIYYGLYYILLNYIAVVVRGNDFVAIFTREDVTMATDSIDFMQLCNVINRLIHDHGIANTNSIFFSYGDKKKINKVSNLKCTSLLMSLVRRRRIKKKSNNTSIETGRSVNDTNIYPVMYY